ncbi:MAG: methyltransferase domain-containing protein, partial [Clostridiaceae bacterium]|nr:methyltransferase domain-containing protein [Clostridiaceae bacterium]
SFDVVLCMGAMYHLQSDDEKIQAIRNCVSVCKPGGLVVLSYLNYFAVVLRIHTRAFPLPVSSMSR